MDIRNVDRFDGGSGLFNSRPGMETEMPAQLETAQGLAGTCGRAGLPGLDERRKADLRLGPAPA